MKTFIDMVWATFLARVKPVSTRAKPACMNMTRKPVISVHIMLMAERFCADAAGQGVQIETTPS